VLSQGYNCPKSDAQPLVVPNQQIAAGPTPGAYQVVYVATEANTIYAISASNGAVLLSRNLGTPVPMPLGCGNNGPNVGINSTPVIDVAAQALYVVAYTLMSGIPTYQVFALNLSDLTDKISPVTVAASHTLSDGTTYNFNAQFQRQRAALLESSGIIYADLPVSAISPPTSRVAGSWDGRPARWLRSRRTR
jgi:glucose dehydrogenase